jgi:membrane associated rhomboid family serine protease
MFIPIGDDNPTERRPILNYGLIAVNVLVFLVMLSKPFEAYISWMMIPAQLDWKTLFTSMFMHAGLLHLVGNMLFLWIFGDNVEDRMGRFWYVVFYFACGLAAAAAHILTNLTSVIPTLGASGAVSGVMGAYIVFFPRHHIKTFVWLYVFVNVIRTPAFLWIGIWIGQQILLNTLAPQGGAGVAYLAHIGGFAFGAFVAGFIKVVSGDRDASRRGGADPLDVRASDRRIFNEVAEDDGVQFLDQPGDGYSVLRLSEDPRDVSRISDAVAAVTGESSFDVVDRLVITRGVVAREVPRETAQKIQQQLQALGIPSAIILHNRSNFPPRPVVVDGASWDGRVIRFRAGDQSVSVPWTGPFLAVGARGGDQSFIDLYLNRRAAYRIVDLPRVQLREVGRDGRTEVATNLGGFARAILDRCVGATVNPGIRILAAGAAWDRLDFRSEADYDDYVFWIYNLALHQNSHLRG